MEKDQMKKDEEISAEELEQVSGGMTKADINTVKLMKDFSSLAVDSLQKVNNFDKHQLGSVPIRRRGTRCEFPFFFE